MRFAAYPASGILNAYGQIKATCKKKQTPLPSPSRNTSPFRNRPALKSTGATGITAIIRWRIYETNAPARRVRERTARSRRNQITRILARFLCSNRHCGWSQLKQWAATRCGFTGMTGIAQASTRLTICEISARVGNAQQSRAPYNNRKVTSTVACVATGRPPFIPGRNRHLMTASIAFSSKPRPSCRTT